MKYNLCKSCIFYEDDIKTPFLRQPKHCTHPQLDTYFGLSVGGFMTGIDIFHCDCFIQHAAECGDCYIELPNGYVSYVIPKERKERGIYVLSNNEKNIKLIKSKKTHPYGKIKPKPQRQHLEENNSSSDCNFGGTEWCPF